eukprot:1974402-Rhodomonas_salina.1
MHSLVRARFWTLARRLDTRLVLGPERGHRICLGPAGMTVSRVRGFIVSRVCSRGFILSRVCSPRVHRIQSLHREKALGTACSRESEEEEDDGGDNPDGQLPTGLDAVDDLEANAFHIVADGDVRIAHRQICDGRLPIMMRRNGLWPSYLAYLPRGGIDRSL